jgi:hypothetical protein
MLDDRTAPIRDAARSVVRHDGIAPTRWNRAANDAYFTIDAPWIIPALLSKVKIVGPVLEPAAGVEHLVRELRRGHGLEGHRQRFTRLRRAVGP